MDLLKVIRNYWEKLKILIGIILFFVGFSLWAFYPENLFFSDFISPLGQFIAAVASVQLIYEILFRNRDREIFFIEMSKLWEDKIPSIIHCSPEFYEGRRNPSEKIEFYRRARYEVIEIAATLHALSFYYESIAGKEYSDHVKDLLRNGVNIKLFLLDPDSVFAKTYNESTEEEDDILEKIRESITKFSEIIQKYNAETYPGRIELYMYTDMPFYNGVFLDINRSEAELGEIFVSHYLHKMPRSENPGFSFKKCTEPELFEKYHTSICRLIERSKKISS